MEYQDNFFDLKNEIIRSHIRANMMNVLSVDEHYEIAIKPSFDTACWYYDFDKKANKIFIGDGIFDRLKEGWNDKEKVLMSYFIHESAHSIFTGKNLKALSARLKDEKLNFQLFNLFEDARIESKIREYFGYEFNWSSFEPVPEDSEDEKASTTLFKIIQTEDKEVFDVPYYEKVKNYYKKIINVKTEDEMIEIMKEWVKDFPNDVEPENNKNMASSISDEQSNDGNNEPSNSSGGNKQDGSGKEKGKNGAGNEKDENEVSDLELAAQLQSDPDLASEFEDGTQIVVGDAKKQLDELEEEIANTNDIKYLNPVESGNEILETSTSTKIFQDKDYNSNKIFEDKLARAETRLKRILKSIDIESINSTSHDKKFNIKGVVHALSGLPSAKPYKKNVEESYEETKKKVFILMDGSRSMFGLPEKNMLTFCLVANRLSQLNLFEGWIGGSKMSRNGKSYSQAFQLPIKDGYITSFEADADSEGLGAAIKTHLDYMKQSDYIFVVTDGNIHDLDLQFLKHEHVEIFDKTIGIYMGKRKHSNSVDMGKWFKKSIIKDKFEDVIEEIVEFLDPNANVNQKLHELEVENNEKIELYEESFNLNRI